MKDLQATRTLYFMCDEKLLLEGLSREMIHSDLFLRYHSDRLDKM